MQGRWGGFRNLQASTRSWLTGLFFSASNSEERYSSFQPGMMGGFITGLSLSLGFVLGLGVFLGEGDDEVEMISHSSPDDDPSMSAGSCMRKRQARMLADVIDSVGMGLPLAP